MHALRPHPLRLLPWFQDENKKLFALNQQLQTKLDELQHQLNKVVEENVRLRAQQRSPTTPPSLPKFPRSPTTPTSPLSVIMEPTSLAEEQKEEEIYAQVDMSKVWWVWLLGVWPDVLIAVV